METNIRGTIVSTPAPSSDVIKTVYARSAPVQMLSTTIATNTSEAISPDVVVTKTPATALKPGLTVIKAPPLRVKPATIDGSKLPLPADAMPLPKAAFDYKTAGLIALAAVVVLGGLTMWAGQSKGKTQAVANRRRAKRAKSRRGAKAASAAFMRARAKLRAPATKASRQPVSESRSPCGAGFQQWFGHPGETVCVASDHGEDVAVITFPDGSAATGRGKNLGEAINKARDLRSRR